MRYILFLIKIALNTYFFYTSVSVFPILPDRIVNGVKKVLSLLAWELRALAAEIHPMLHDATGNHAAFDASRPGLRIVSATGASGL